MANQGAKKRKEENARHMKNLQRLIIACNVIFILVRMVIFHSTFTWKHWIGLVLTSVAYAIPYQQIANMAQPSYDDNGELLDGGFDMSTGGVCGYLHDIIYITSFVQVMSIISAKFWYIYLVVRYLYSFYFGKHVFRKIFFWVSEREFTYMLVLCFRNGEGPPYTNILDLTQNFLI
ncbi:hypothetical protein SO802_019256 [Lithocarpus litseifolius]|uniref:Transmembrane protein 208 n=1 Tax=Lithocarpus litseifolius TaxID=425828 RepID=A0AAW2CNP0_9ROSI